MRIPPVSKALPRYPIYVPSKGRADQCFTARFLQNDGVPYYIVVEPQEFDAYAANFPEENILVLPFSNLGLGSIPARNWIREHSQERGAERHWQIDDNCRLMRRLWRSKRLPVNSGIALACTEDFVDRYTNVGIAGLNYTMFVVPYPDGGPKAPFQLNCHVYSCTLFLNSLPYKWRGRYNEDTDICLQVLSGGWCTILMNAFMIDKQRTMTMKGGNSDLLYTGDGRLKMARELQRRWPGVVETKRRFGRPQHVIRASWRKFDTQLIRKPDLVLPDGPDEYGMVLKQVRSKDD